MRRRAQEWRVCGARHERSIGLGVKGAEVVCRPEGPTALAQGKTLGTRTRYYLCSPDGATASVRRAPLGREEGLRVPPTQDFILG